MSTEDQMTEEMEKITEKKEPPTLMEDFDPKRRELAESYKRIIRKIGRILGIISLAATLLIIISRITVFLKAQLQTLFTDEILLIAAFFTIVFIVINIIEMFISYWTGLRINRRFGLSKLTTKRWLWRNFKGLMISYGFGLVMIEVAYFILRVFPTYWWLIATIVMVFTTIIIANLAPIVLAPIFYKFEPLENEYPDLAVELVKMMEEEKVKSRSFVWKLGKTSTVGNAGIFGMWKSRRIIIADTMLEQYTPTEIKLTLAHELAHLKHRDLLKSMILGSVSTLIIFYFTDILYKLIAPYLGYGAISDIAGLPLLAFCIGIFGFLTDVTTAWYSRRKERQADEFAFTKIPDVRAAKSLFIRLADQNLSDLHPPWYEKIFFMSHPPILERIAHAEAIIKK
ncbi:MAG: M48 family metallopeptidase [Candidatus Hermodarchaeota archaeon]